MDLPITVNSIDIVNGSTIKMDSNLGHCGDMVAVRPCDDRYQNKTFLGVFIGDVALSHDCKFNNAIGQLSVMKDAYIPAIFIPELNVIMYGISCWWHHIESETDLEAITDEDINDIWYLRALKQLKRSSVPIN